MLLCFPVLAMPPGSPEAAIPQEPGASFARGGSPREHQKPCPSPALEVCKLTASCSHPWFIY